MHDVLQKLGVVTHREYVITQGGQASHPESPKTQYFWPGNAKYVFLRRGTYNWNNNAPVSQLGRAVRRRNCCTIRPDATQEIAPEFFRIHDLLVAPRRWKRSEGAPVICHTARKLIYPSGEARLEQTMGHIEGKPAPAGLAVARRILLGEPLEDGYGATETATKTVT